MLTEEKFVSNGAITVTAASNEEIKIRISYAKLYYFKIKQKRAKCNNRWIVKS